jgi:Cys-tRNA(Pro)/Cys-tRNA(Cys) deacylase
MVNNITRLLDANKIPYRVFTMPVEKLGAMETARLLGVSPGLVFKTIVVTRIKPKKPVLAVIPGDCQLDLKSLANLLDEKKIFLPTEKEAETLTGLQAGGISPLALLNKGFQVVVDSQAEGLQELHISGGQRGLNIRMPVRDLLRLTKARLGGISQPIQQEDGIE